MRIETKFSIGDKVSVSFMAEIENMQTGYVSGISIEVDVHGYVTTRYSVTIPYEFENMKHECLISAHEHELKKVASDENTGQVQPPMTRWR